MNQRATFCRSSLGQNTFNEAHDKYPAKMGVQLPPTHTSCAVKGISLTHYSRNLRMTPFSVEKTKDMCQIPKMANKPKGDLPTLPRANMKYTSFLTQLTTLIELKKACIL